MLSSRRVIVASFSGALLALTAACTTLPDTSAYTAASVQLKSSAGAAGSALHGELVRLADQVPPGQRERATRLASDFDTEWQKTVNALQALASYAESIEAITKAGNSGGEAARGVAQSVSTLVDTLGVTVGAGVLSVATDTLALLNTALANMRAARSLDRSLEIADPLVQDMAVVVAAQVDQARGLFANAIDAQRQLLNTGEIEDFLRLDGQLAAAEGLAALRLAALSEQADREAERRAAAAELERIRGGRAALAPRLAEYRAALAALAARQRAGAELFAATGLAVASWREGHEKMVRAIRERQPVSFQSLAAAATEVRALVERWRDL